MSESEEWKRAKRETRAEAIGATIAYALMLVVAVALVRCVWWCTGKVLP
jgi:hypothetical protein